VQIDSGGTIARLDDATSVAASTLNYSVSAGSNRALVACFSWESNGQSQIDGATYGGESMTQIFQQDTPDGGYSSGAACFYILDAGIEAASGTTISPTYSGTSTDNEIIHAASYAGVDQTGGGTTVLETHTAESNESTPNPFTTIDLTEASGNLVIAIVTGGNNTTASWQSDMTEQNDQADSSSFSSFADRLSDTNSNVTIEGTIASQNRASAGSAELAAATSSSGTVQSTQIDFGWFSDSPSDWNEVYVGATTANGSITIDILDENESDTGLGCTISGGTSSCTIDISSLDPAGDDTQIYIKATLTDSGGTPYLEDWGVSVPEYSLIFLGLAPLLPKFIKKAKQKRKLG
jgi:hypothetical protein